MNRDQNIGVLNLSNLIGLDETMHFKSGINTVHATHLG
jgi:hypothetical protein